MGEVRLRELLFRGDVDTDISQLAKIFQILGKWVGGWVGGWVGWLNDLETYREYPPTHPPFHTGTPTEANWPGYTALPDYPRYVSFFPTHPFSPYPATHPLSPHFPPSLLINPPTHPPIQTQVQHNPPTPP